MRFGGPRASPSRDPSRSNAGLSRTFAGLALLLVVALHICSAQTLARPGWVGSGMTVERWWPHAVFCEVTPDSLPSGTAAQNSSTLHRLSDRIEDLQALGVDGVLLQGLETPGQRTPATPNTHQAIVSLDPRFGTLDQFDDLVADAVRHGLRVLVELNGAPANTSLANEARFWLNRGVTGIALSGSGPAQIRLVRGVLRGYIGDRVLIAQDTGAGPSTDSPPDTATSPAQLREASHTSSASRGDQPDLLRIALPPVSSGAQALRSTIERARSMAAGRSPIPMLGAGGIPGDPLSARVLATVLLGSGGAVLLRADDLDLSHANAASSQSTVFAWYREWSGLHRGNAAMRSGEHTLLDHDADGALVWVRAGRAGAAPIVAICNVTGQPIRLSLISDIQKLRLRGSFLRTVARSDGGMGAMPLREVVLPAYAVYVGELSR